MAQTSARVHEQHTLISDGWIEQVEDIVEAIEHTDVSVGRVTMCLPKLVTKGNEDAYAPQIVSLGPYHHRALKEARMEPYHLPLSHISQMEMYKLKSTRDAADKKAELIRSVFTKTIDPETIGKLERFYDWKVEENDVGCRKFGWMMTIDAFFLYQFLKRSFDFTLDDHDRNKSDHPSAVGSIKCDIVKLENQIPLFLLKQVAEALQASPDQDFDGFLQGRIASMCFFTTDKDFRIKEVADEQHLLGCMHKYVSSFLKFQRKEEGGVSATCCQRISSGMGDMAGGVGGMGDMGGVSATCCQQISSGMGDMAGGVCGVFCAHPAAGAPHNLRLNARELVKSGIRLKAFTKKSEKIRFDRQSDTLYLPQISIIDSFTEAVLRNLLALEFIEPSRERVMMRYVELMDCLIDTADDVKLLRNRGIIVRGSLMISDEYVADMWEGMCKPFFAGSAKPFHDVKTQIQESLINNYYKVKLKAILWGVGKQLVTGPLKAVAAFLGIPIPLAR